MACIPEKNFYPAHLEVAVLMHSRRGRQEPGRHVVCLVCGVDSNTRTRNGDAAFLREHRRCGYAQKTGNSDVED